MTADQFMYRTRRASLTGRTMRWLRGDRRVRVPTRLQFQTTECGVAALSMILAHHGKHVPTEEIRRVTGTSRDCMNGADMARGARHFGLQCRAYRREVDDLRALRAPFVVHVRFIHFMVVEGISDTHLLVSDPHAGRCEIPLESFAEDFTGIVLTFEPSLAFRRDGQAIAPGRALARRTGAAEYQLAAVAIAAGLALPLPLILFAFLIGASLDAAGASGGVQPAAMLALLGAIALRAVLSLLQSAALSALQRRLAVAEAADMLRQLLAVPYTFFAYRLPSRLHATLYSSDLVAKLLCEQGILPLLARAGGVVLTIVAAAFVSPDAAFALAAIAAVYVAALTALARWRSGHERGHRAYADDELGSLAASLTRIEPMKLSGREREFVVDGMGLNARQQGGFQRYAPVARAADTAGAVMEYAAIGSVLLIGATQVAADALTAGAAFALVVLAWAGASALRELGGLRGKLDQLNHTLLHIEDVHCERAEVGEPSAVMNAASGFALELRDVTFGYAEMKPPLIREASIAIRRGEQLGITGPSGGGKSTLVGILAGLHRPSAGTVATAPGHRAAWIDKTPFFFEGSVRENLRLWDPPIDAADLEDALRDACVDEVLAARPGGLDSPVAARGRNFSGGQLQRLEIARALLRRPTLLVLDEATDALDPALEARIRANLRRRGCTLVLVSHRSSTLAACERVIHVAGGRIVERVAAGSQPAAELPAEPVQGEPARAVHRPALIEAFRRVGQSIGETITIPDELPEGPPYAVLEALAAHNRLPIRRVRFVMRKQWRRDHGPLLAFLRGSQLPVAVLPQGGRYRIVDASGAVRPELPDDATLAGEAWMLYRREGALGTSPWRLLTSGWTRARGDFLRATAMSVPLALLAVCLPAVAAGLLVPGALQPASAGVVLAGAALVLVLLESARVLALLRFEGRMELSVLATLYQRIARILPAFTRSEPPETIARSLVGVPRWIERLRGPALRQALECTTTLACIGWIAFQSAALAAWTAALCVAALVLPPLVALPGRRLEERYWLERSVIRTLLMDMLIGLARLRVLERSATALEIWRKRYEGEKRLEVRIRRIASWGAVVADSYPWLAVAATAWLLASMSTLAPATAILIAVWLAARAATSAGASIAALVRSLPFAGHVGLLTAAPCDPNGSALPAERAALEARDIVYHYPGTTQRVLDGVTLRVEPGELIAIAGPSGSGKSTLLRLLLAFELPDTGRIAWGGTSLAALDLHRWRERIAAVFQDDRLGQASTLRSQISGSARLGAAEVWEAVRLAAVDADIRAMPMGMQTIVEGNKVSTGQEQRILIARALARRPSLLVLDEATNAIPEAMQARVLDQLRALGITTILVTHRESAIARCDRVYLLEDGRLAWSGKPEGLAARQGLLERLRAEQMEENE